ncbi:DUF6268 family outer membrane beta-barrel protein [Verrucomicrobiota bacterium]
MKITVVICVCMLVLFSSGADAEDRAWKARSDYCQILDNQMEPVCRFNFDIIPSSRFEGAGKSTLFEMEADGEFAYLRDKLYGDIDLSLAFKSIIFVGSARLDLPDQVVKLALDAGWAGRFQDGLAVQVRAYPGIYSDLEGWGLNTIFMPFSCSAIKTFSRAVSCIIGAELRPDFERFFMPIVGMHWEISDLLRLEVGLPESRILCFPHPDWSTHLGFDWNNTSFRLDDDRDMITVEDFKAYVGITRWISDQMHVTGEFGRVFWRSVEYDNPSSDIEIDDQYFLRLGVGGPF